MFSFVKYLLRVQFKISILLVKAFLPENANIAHLKNANHCKSYLKFALQEMVR